MSPLAWLLVAAGLVLLGLLFVLHRARRRLGARPSAPPERVRVAVAGRRPVRPIAEEDLAAVPVPVRACPACGSPGMRPLRMDEGGVPGAADLLDRQACPRCGHEGLAVVFDRREDYASFVRRLDATWRASRGKP